jgi:putative PIN family toxin of toxin-antitoxin system
MEANKIVVDANVWIRYARISNISPITQRILKYNLLPISQNYLLSEVQDAIIKNNWINIRGTEKIIYLINRISLNSPPHSIYRLSPDFKDNYLFDLAIQNNCKFIVSDDSKLIQFPLKPVPVKTSSWFLKTYPL